VVVSRLRYLPVMRLEPAQEGREPNCNGPAHVFGSSHNAPNGGLQWFDPSPYDAPLAGTFGTCGNGTVRGPGLRTADVAFQKEFPIQDKKRIEFRAEFINFTNTPIYYAPGTFLGPNLGKITNSQGPRNIQFALKFFF
jgi:hypothetical protein